MRSDSRRAQSDCRTFPLHPHDDAAHSNCLSKARAEDGCPARGTFTSGCDGGDAKARDRSARLRRLKGRGRLTLIAFVAASLCEALRVAHRATATAVQ